MESSNPDFTWLWSALIGWVLGLVTMRFFYALGRRDEDRDLASSILTEVDHIRHGLEAYRAALHTIRQKNQFAVPEPPFKKENLRIYESNAAAIGRLPRELRRAVVGFYHFVETMHDRWKDIDRQQELTGQRRALTIEFLSNLDKALAASAEIAKRLEALSRKGL